MNDMQSHHWDTLNWGAGEGDCETSAIDGGTTRCSPSRSNVLDAHRCIILESYLADIGVTDYHTEGEHGILETSGRGWTSNNDTTWVGIDKGDVPEKYHSALTKLFNKLDAMRIAATVDTPCKGGGDKGHIYDLANERYLESDGCEIEHHEYHDKYWIFTGQAAHVDDLTERIDDSSYIDEDTFVAVEQEAIDEYWQSEGKFEMGKRLAHLHSHLEFDLDEWDDMEEEEEEIVKPFVDEIGKYNDLSYILSAISEMMGDATHEVRECGPNDYYVHDNTETAIGELAKILTLHTSFQIMWDIAIEQGDHDLLLKHIRNLSCVSANNPDSIHLAILESQRLSLDCSIKRAKARGQKAMFTTEEVMGCAPQQD